MEKSELLSVKDASEILGVSTATVKNWIKLGKIKGQKSGSFFLLSKEDVLDKCNELVSSSALKSRRNKSRVSSNFIPKSYISASSPNYKTIKNLILSEDFSKNYIDDVLCAYSQVLLKKAGVSQDISKILLQSLKSPSNSDVSLNTGNTSLDLKSLAKDYPLVLIPGEDTLGMLYLSLRSMQDKKSTGSYYTPFFVADELIKNTFSDIPSMELSCQKILDPACGTGNFLIRLPEDIPLSNIYGSDIDSTAIALSRINLAIKYRITTAKELDILTSNISVRDFLFDPQEHAELFDHLIGNPPWGYSYAADQISSIKKNFKSFEGKGKPESFTLFVEEGIKCSKGLCFVLPETILSSDYHSGIRKYILKNSDVRELCYLGEAFDNVQCPCITLSLSHKSDLSDIKVRFYKKQNKGGRFLSLIKDFSVPESRINADNFNILADKAEYAILQKMQSVPHFTLKDNCDFALGIVTGANKSLLSDTCLEGYEPIIKGKDISKYSLSVGNTYTSFSPDKYQQVAPLELYRAENKLFYRFISGEPVVALDTRGLLSLNSANIMVPKVKGYSNYYIMAILNSSAMSFYYRHTCKNLKVLRSALEALPIPICDEDTQREITKMAEMISDYYNNNDQSFGEEIILETIKRLDKCVANLYNLNADQVKILSE